MSKDLSLQKVYLQQVNKPDAFHEMNRCTISHISNVTDFTTANVAGSGGARLILGDLSRRTRFGARPQNTAQTLKPGQNRLFEASSHKFTQIL